MAPRRSERLPYQFTLRGFVAVTTALTIALCLFWYGGEDFVGPIRRLIRIEYPVAINPFGWWACVAGASFLGGALGAVIGQVFRDERGGAASMGAYLGALAGPLIVLIGYLPLMLAIWMWLGCPD